DGVTGLSFRPADVSGLAAAVGRVLADPAAANIRAAAAREHLTGEFSWEVVAAETVRVYKAAKRRERTPLARPHIPTRPLPDRDPTKPIS
ncbi:MAG: glycosyltransferase, partial [Mycobacterium sp.]|nr:glycosyltransferase [Mycobacterium sp.]